MTIKDFRLAYAARCAQALLSQGRNLAAFHVLYHVVRNHADFGLDEPSAQEMRDVQAVKKSNDVTPYVKRLLDQGHAVDVDNPEDDASMIVASYLAGLVTNMPSDVMTLALLATRDQHIHDVLMISSFGKTSKPHLHSVPLLGLGLAARVGTVIAEKEVKRLLLGSQHYVETDIIAPSHIHESRSQVTQKVTFGEHPPFKGEDSDTEVVNGIAFNERIVKALRGLHEVRRSELCQPVAGSAYESVLGPVVDLTRMATAKDSHGLVIALRSRNPETTVRHVERFMADRKTRPDVLKEPDANALLASLIAHQAAAMLDMMIEDKLPRPILINDDYEILSAYDEDLEVETVASSGQDQERELYNTEFMSAQKIVFQAISPFLITPTIWAIKEDRPITEDLIGRIAEIRNLQNDDIGDRATTIRTLGAQSGLEIREDVARRIAAFVVNVDDIEGAVRLAALRGTDEDLERSCRALLAGSKTGKSFPVQAPANYDIRLVRAKEPIEKIVGELAPLRDRPIPILFYGLPGTSKTSLARHVAERMGLPVLVKKAADIFGRYVGDNEKAIEKAFQEAVSRNAFLILDEVDSFLRSRDLAQQSWERNQVNAMLTAMDTHSLPFACTTNYLKDLDPAAVRRFLFKYELLPLDTARARLAWTGILKLSADDLSDEDFMTDLTIADFDVVARQMQILGENSADYAKKALLKEKTVRGENSKNPMGFLTPRPSEN